MFKNGRLQPYKMKYPFDVKWYEYPMAQIYMSVAAVAIDTVCLCQAMLYSFGNVSAMYAIIVMALVLLAIDPMFAATSGFYADYKWAKYVAVVLVVASHILTGKLYWETAQLKYQMSDIQVLEEALDELDPIIDSEAYSNAVEELEEVKQKQGVAKSNIFNVIPLSSSAFLLCATILSADKRKKIREIDKYNAANAQYHELKQVEIELQDFPDEQTMMAADEAKYFAMQQQVEYLIAEMQREVECTIAKKQRKPEMAYRVLKK